MFTPQLWLVLLLVFCVAEGLTVGLVTIWFALGSLIALLLTLAGCGSLVQLLGFVVVSVISMLAIRPLATKIFTPRHEPTNADRIIGHEAVVLQTIDAVQGTGQVKVEGKLWTARALDGQSIPQESRVVIRRIEGVKVLVEPLE